MLSEHMSFKGILYQDVTYTVSFNVGYNSLSINSPNADGYTIIGMMLKTGSTVALRNDAALLGFSSSDNANRLQFYSSTASSGTVTVRYFYTLGSNIQSI